MHNPVNIFWFRRDLRIEDNHGLFRALQNNLPVLPIFIFDKNIIDYLPNATDARISFIHDALNNLNEKLKKYNSSLYVIHESPAEAFKKLSKSYIIQNVYANHDYEPYALKRDQEIQTLLKKLKIEFHTFKDQVIFEKNEVIKTDSNPYTIFTPYANAWKKKLEENTLPFYPSENLPNAFIQDTNLPFLQLSDIGFIKSTIHFPSNILSADVLISYENKRNYPALDATSKLSIHLRFGTISIRKLVKKAKETNQSWLNELIWREFFMMILYHFPQVVKQCFKPKYEKLNWRNNIHEFEAWCNGETGYAIVDAGMRELNQSGFMHNRVRMIVASFLCKHLLIDWRWGEAYFAEKLLDYELSSNNGNWQWAASCGCDAVPYFRIFNPIEQAKKYDPKNEYINKWLIAEQSKTNLPIVEHTFARKRALDVYKKCLYESFKP